MLSAALVPLETSSPHCAGGPPAVPWALLCLPSARASLRAPQVAALELLQAPGLPYQLPRQLAGYPALAGGAVRPVADVMLCGSSWAASRQLH